METVTKKLYEGMFLVDSAQAASDWDGVIAAVKKVLERAGAEIVSIRKWEEMKLAYTIRGCSRGTYLLTYFRAEGANIGGIEREVQISERILRVLILNTERMGQKDIEKDIEKETPAMLVEKSRAKKAEKTLEDFSKEDIGADDSKDEKALGLTTEEPGVPGAKETAGRQAEEAEAGAAIEQAQEVEEAAAAAEAERADVETEEPEHVKVLEAQEAEESQETVLKAVADVDEKEGEPVEKSKAKKPKRIWRKRSKSKDESTEAADKKD